jgi:hypothetical protein
MRCISNLSRDPTTFEGRVAQWIRRRSSEPKIVGSSPTVVTFFELFKYFVHANMVICNNSIPLTLLALIAQLVRA